MARPKDNHRKGWSTRKVELYPQLAMRAIQDYIAKHVKPLPEDPVSREASLLARKRWHRPLPRD